MQSFVGGCNCRPDATGRAFFGSVSRLGVGIFDIAPAPNLENLADRLLLHRLFTVATITPLPVDKRAHSAFSDVLHPSAVVHALIGRQALLVFGIPEPGSVALLTVALLALVSARRKVAGAAR